MNAKLLSVVLTGFLAIFAASEAHAQQIPDWVKNIAGFWANGDISDTEYAASISYLAEQGIITIPQAKQVQDCDERIDDLILHVFSMTGGMITATHATDQGALDHIQVAILAHIASVPDKVNIILNECSPTQTQNDTMMLANTVMLDTLNLISAESGYAGSGSTQPSSDHAIQVDDCRDTDGGGASVTGRFTADRYYESVLLDVALLDINGGVVDVAPKFISTISAGETKPFKQEFFDIPREWDSCQVTVNSVH